jgi:hypothetical protein
MAVRSSFVCVHCGKAVIPSHAFPVVYLRGKRYHYACFEFVSFGTPIPGHKKEKPAKRLVLKVKGGEGDAR